MESWIWAGVWAAVAVLGSTLLIWRYVKRISILINLPPGTAGWPFIGETLQFMLERDNFIPRRASKYGDVFRTSLGGKGVIISENLDFNKYILRNEDTFFQADYPRLVKTLGGKWGSISLHGELHKQYRKMVQLSIARQLQAKDFVSHIQSCVEDVLGSWPGHTVSTQDGAQMISYLVGLKLVFGCRLEHGIESKLLFDMKELCGGIDAGMKLLPGLAFWRALKAKSRALQEIEELLESEVSFNSPFLVEMSKGSISKEQRLEMILGLLMGAMETANRFMSLALLFLQETPEALRLLREENMSILRSKASHGLVDTDFRKMNFTNCVIKEVLRYSSVILPRRVINDVHYRDFVIPKGWKVLIFRRLDDIARLSEPTKFDPWRWQEGSEDYESLTFGGGRRICPGMDVTKLLFQVFLHYAATKISWKPIGDNTLTLFPRLSVKNGYRIQVEVLNG